MKYTNDEIYLFLKAFTRFLKEAYGKGPKNIFIRSFDGEIHIFVQGIVSNFEKHLISNFGEEVIECLTDIYQRDCLYAEQIFLEQIDYKYNLKFYELESDFISDQFIFKMQLIG